MSSDAVTDDNGQRINLEDVRARALALNARDRETLLKDLQEAAIRDGACVTDRRIVFWLNDSENPTHVQMSRPVPEALVPSILWQLRRVSPQLKPIKWARARLFDTHEELEALWHSSGASISRGDRADIFRLWRIVKSLAICLVRRDQRGLDAMSKKAEQALRDSREGELTDAELEYEKRPGACLIDCEYGGQGALIYGDVEERGAFTEPSLGLADDSIWTAEAQESGSVRLEKTAELGAGKGPMAESAVRWLRLIYPLCQKPDAIDLTLLLCGQGWMMANEDWAPKKSALWSWIVRINDAALAKGSAPLFTLPRKPTIYDEYRPDFDPRRAALREEVEQWLSDVRAGGTDPTADDFEELLKSCCYALGCEAKSVDNLFAAKAKRSKHKKR